MVSLRKKGIAMTVKVMIGLVLFLLLFFALFKIYKDMFAGGFQ